MSYFKTIVVLNHDDFEVVGLRFFCKLLIISNKWILAWLLNEMINHCLYSPAFQMQKSSACSEIM